MVSALSGSPFRWFGFCPLPPGPLSLLVCLCVSGTSILEPASQAPKVGLGLPFRGEEPEGRKGLLSWVVSTTPLPGGRGAEVPPRVLHLPHVRDLHR